MRRWQSGQLQETVNLPGSPYEGSNPSRRTNTKTQTKPKLCLGFVVFGSREGFEKVN